MKIKARAALHNLGCKVNAYETEAMQQLLEEAGYEIVPFSEEADVYVINTCSVTNMADRKSRQMIHRARKKNPNAVIVGAGCYVQTKEAESLFGELDIVIGNAGKQELVQLLEEYRATGKKISNVIDINVRGLEYETFQLGRTAEHTRAFIKVQDGCNQFCSYCIIPYVRGRVRSRALPEVVAEITQMAANGYKEVVLTGIHLSSFGIDTGETLLGLIEQVHQVNGVERIRLGSLEPRIVTEAFVKRLSELPKICPHFHLSLQSGCDSVLARMNRHYDTAEYEAGCELLRTYFEHPAITTDIIVGFPGETEAEFEMTRAYLEKIRFYEIHVFKYSAREGTKAAAMENQIPERIKAERSSRLISLGERMSREFREYYIGKTVTILTEEPVLLEGKTYLSGYTKEYVRVAVPIQKEHVAEYTNRFLTGKLLDIGNHLLVEFSDKLY